MREEEAWWSPRKPEYKPQSPSQALAYLMEEMGEAVQASGKILRWGLDSVNPELPPERQETNRHRLARELRDVETAIWLVRRWVL
jgi:NTP pyrophosphatase (non-canonical NTP hydrolase)